jgi:hypothetical protein
MAVVQKDPNGRGEYIEISILRWTPNLEGKKASRIGLLPSSTNPVFFAWPPWEFRDPKVAVR